MSQDQTIQRFYFLIGVAEYDDTSLNLRSPVNDVLDLLQVLLRMGMDLEGAEVCTSPALTAEQVAEHYAYGAKDFNKDKAYAEMALLGVTFGGGTKHDMVVASHRLKARMNDAEGRPHLLVSWSGHTIDMGGQLHFCPSNYPSDWTPSQGSYASPWPYVGMVGEAGIFPYNWPHPLPPGARSDHSIVAIIDGCQAGRVGQLATKDPRQDVVLTASNGEIQVRERLLGGAWRGLLTWAVCRVLEQHGPVGGDAVDSGLDLSYGSLLRSVCALALAVQGSATRAALPELHGLAARDAGVLERRVFQDLSAPAGRTSQVSTRVGGDVQLWGDIDHFMVYEVYVTPKGKAEMLWSRVVFYSQSQGKRLRYTYDKKEHLFEANQEYWYYASPLGPEPITEIRLAVATRYDTGASDRASNITGVNEALDMGRVMVTPVFPDWKPVPVGNLPSGYLQETRCSYALRITSGRVEWLKPATGASPFKNAQVGSTIYFTRSLSDAPAGTEGCSAALPD
ncbi:MAG: hypothetical protein H6741_18880 [Alphaproteobacteria bacterium]|nr:hypothetical protein [Alphaproteobacteria bacterium]MCB9794775.1 hypothetical protein [Alphaproteobacteria bacterium]